MSEANRIRAEFHNVLGNFTLNAAFEVPARGVTALFGPSGCGKTTVLRCIAGLIRVKDGYFDIDGEIWQDPDQTFIPTYRRPLGYVFQEASLFPHLSVRRNLLFGAPPEKPADRPAIDFDEVVDLLGIRPLLDRSPRNLSGGERQRVGIGRALLAELIAGAEATGIWTIQTSVFPENRASLALHQRCGFRVVGTRERVAKRDGIWRDTVFLERRSEVVK